MSKHVLIVDDDCDSREALRELLRSWGHETEVAANGREAITLAMDCRPDVVLLDLGLPDMDGHEVARRIRSDAHRPCVIALTGSDEDEAPGTFDAYIVKPADPEQLRAMIARASVERGAAVRVDDAK